VGGTAPQPGVLRIQTTGSGGTVAGACFDVWTDAGNGELGTRIIDGMCDRQWGRIVTISSGAGTGGVAIGVSPYSAGKGGGIAFTRTLALEVARSGVTCNTIALGLMTNPDQSVTAHLARAIPVGRTGTPEDIAAACVWLASDEASWVTAQTIEINGGSITT